MYDIYVVYYTKDCEVYGKQIEVSDDQILEDIIKDILPKHITIHAIIKL